jgi:aspartate/methionine/tyrosine aminotransferase
VYATPRYLAWAIEHYGRVPFDLASSGIAAVDLESLGDVPSLGDARGPSELRQGIARFNDVPETETIATLGTTHALWLAYATLLRPGDEVLVEAPGYEPIWSLAEAAGAKLVRFERDPRARFGLDVSKVEAALTPRTRIVALSSPHNPSGVRADPEALRLVANLAARQGAYLLVDEVYAPFGQMSPGELVWGKSARRIAANVLAVSSLTKCFGLGPQRIGWLLGPREVVLRAEGTLVATCSALPGAHASLGAWALGRIDKLYERATELTLGKREVVRAWMRARKDLTWSDPADGLFGFAMRESPEDLLPLIEAGAKRDGLLVAAGVFFGIPNGFRLSWTLPRDRLDGALELLGHLLG